MLMNTKTEYLDREADVARNEADVARDEADLDRILGDRALFEISEPQKYGGPSPPTLYRAVRAGKVKVIRNGDRTRITRGEMKRILLKGIGPVPFAYGKKSALTTP
jgi:hypothetical protein